jgi:hypothetical protein
MDSDLGFARWGGQDLNLRPTDYESDLALSSTRKTCVKTRDYRLALLAGPLGRELGGDEHVLAQDAAFADRSADSASLPYAVAVSRCR